MESEFQESDIIFSNDQEQDQLALNRIIIRDELEENFMLNFEDMLAPVHGNPRAVQSSMCQSRQKNKKRITNSPPVDIPNNFLRRPDNSDGSFEDDGDDHDHDEVIPPHLIVGRRVAGKIASSLCPNSGGMMKGRHMHEFRNSILRMTGFLES